MDQLPRTPLGIESFDNIIEGGFPRGSLILVAGHPGAGKTIFAATYLYNGAVKYDEKGLYVSFVEDKHSFERYMKKIGLDFSGLEKNGLFYFINIPHIDTETNMESIIKKIMRVIRENDIKRVVIDSITAILQALGDPASIRSFLRNMLVYGTRALGDVTTLVIADLPYSTEVIGYGVEEFIVDGVLVLKAEYTRGTYFRWIEIRKMRGTSIRTTVIPYTIGDKGFSPIVYSTLKTSGNRQKLRPLSKNLSKLFTEIPSGTIVLITGTHGVGRSALALEYALNAVAQDIKTLYISYNEPIESLHSKINYLTKKMFPKDLEFDLGLLNVKYIDPFTQEISSILKKTQDLIISFDPGVIVFDGIEVFSGLIPRHIYRFINRDFTAYIRDHGKILVQTILEENNHRINGYSLFGEHYSIADVILKIKYDPSEPGARTIRVIKSRGSYIKRFRERLEL